MRVLQKKRQCIRSVVFVLISFGVVIGSQGMAQVPVDKDVEMERSMSLAWKEIRAHWAGANDVDESSVDPQAKYATEFFDYFVANPKSPTGRRAAENAFLMWGNLGDAEKVESALKKVSDDSILWSRILDSISSAYFRSKRQSEYAILLTDLKDRLTDPVSRSGVFLRLGRHFEKSGEFEEAKKLYSAVVQMNSTTFDVGKAEFALFELAWLNIGQSAPDFSIDTVSGDPFTLSELKGKVVLLDFWSTKCGPCIKEIPVLKEVFERTNQRDFALVGVARDRDLNVLKKFLNEREMNWTQIQQFKHDGEAERNELILNKYNIYSLPRSFLIDRDGKIFAKDLRGEELARAIDLLLDGKSGRCRLP